MCGITGFFSKSNPLSILELDQITNIITHRGPDASGTYFNNSVGLGHRRLSILDVSENGNQPFFSKDKRYVCVYNGEVYNFKEIAKELNIQTTTGTDTEVLVEAFAIEKEKFVHRLNGMFAFAIYDSEEDELYVFRDRIGIKSVFYYFHNNQFIFSSELKSIQALRKKLTLTLNKKAICSFLHLGYIPAPITIYNEVYKQPAGTYIKINNNGLNIENYWKLNDYTQKNKIENPKEKLKELIFSSVNYRLISDVPLGTFLSGGIDSSLVTAVAQQISQKPINTFSIGFEESKYNESEYAQKVAKHLGTNHNELIINEKDALNLIEKVIDIYDEPYADSSFIPTLLVSEFAKKQVTVALSGDGGDELFLGYGRYNWAQKIKNLSHLRKPIHLASTMLPKLKPKSELFSFNSETNFESHLFSQEQQFFSQNELNKLLVNPINCSISFPNYFSDIREQQSFFDLNYYLPDDLLIKVDRASMYKSLEVRVPLLDYRIIEFALSLNVDYKVHENSAKNILKEILYEFVPQQFFNRPKWGFSIPLEKWLKNELKYLITKYLSKDIIEKHNIVNFTIVAKLLKRYDNNESYLYNRIWTLIVLHLYLEKHG